MTKWVAKKAIQTVYQNLLVSTVSQSLLKAFGLLLVLNPVCRTSVADVVANATVEKQVSLRTSFCGLGISTTSLISFFFFGRPGRATMEQIATLWLRLVGIKFFFFFPSSSSSSSALSRFLTFLVVCICTRVEIQVVEQRLIPTSKP